VKGGRRYAARDVSSPLRAREMDASGITSRRFRDLNDRAYTEIPLNAGTGIGLLNTIRRSLSRAINMPARALSRASTRKTDCIPLVMAAIKPSADSPATCGCAE